MDADPRAIRVALTTAFKALRSAQRTLAALDPQRLDEDQWQDANAHIGEQPTEFRNAIREANRLLGVGQRT